MRDSGSIVLGWLTRLAVSLALLGLVVFDGLALVTAHFNASEHANAAALAAADAYRSVPDADKAYTAAVNAVAADGDTVEKKTFTVDPASGKVTLRLHREASTLWLHRIGPLKKHTDVTATGKATPGP